MSWYSSMMTETPGHDTDRSPQIDRLARRLASEAGANWDAMSNYPGFERNNWRARAERVLEMMQPA